MQEKKNYTPKEIAIQLSRLNNETEFYIFEFSTISDFINDKGIDVDDMDEQEEIVIAEIKEILENAQGKTVYECCSNGSGECNYYTDFSDVVYFIDNINDLK